MKKRYHVILILLCMVFCAIGMSACSGAESGGVVEDTTALTGASDKGKTETSSGNIEAEKVSKRKTLGVKGDPAATVVLTFLNLTGQDISGAAVRYGQEGSFGENLLDEGDLFLSDEERDMYFDTAASEDGAAFLQITVADGSSYVLHEIPFLTAGRARILLQNGILFLEYVDLLTDSEVVTRQAEIDAKSADERAAAEKAAAEKAAAEEEARLAAEQAAWEEQMAQQQAWEQQQLAQQQQYIPETAANSEAGCIGNKGLVY